jgi:DeoR/GlpR family transcriptional regulator of sugar metabolism
VVVGIVDSSKFGKTSFSVFALPDEITQVITDTRAPEAIVEALRTQNIHVVLT